MKILFQGDSITDGGRGRNEDQNHILGHSYAYIVSSKLGFEYPEKNLEFINRGVGGDTSANIYARWQNDALNLNPDIISILAGTNDAGMATRSPKELVCDRFETTLRLILQQTKEVIPQVKFILMEPFLINIGNFEQVFFERRLELTKKNQKVVKELSAEFGAIFVPLQERFNQATKKQPAKYWIWDSVHPTYSGHGLIADAWLNDTKGLINSL